MRRRPKIGATGLATPARAAAALPPEAAGGVSGASRSAAWSIVSSYLSVSKAVERSLGIALSFT